MSHKPYRSNQPKNGKRRLNLMQLRKLPRLTSSNKSVNLFNINLCEELYHKYNNPLFAWEALRIAIKGGEGIPHWVVSYLVKTTDAIFKVLSVDKSRKPRELASALNITGSKMKKFQEFEEDLRFYYRVEELTETKSLEEGLGIAGRELKIHRGQESLEDHYYEIQKIVKKIYG